LSILDFFQSVQKAGNQVKYSQNKEKMLKNELLIIHGTQCWQIVLNIQSLNMT
jgi:hypothetical protein